MKIQLDIFIYRLRLLVRDFISLLVLLLSLIKRRKGIVILVYHSVEDMPWYKDLPRLNTPPSLFEQHMEYLARSGYKVISLDDLVSHFEKKCQIPSKCVVLTFDDGFKNWHKNAYPILRKFGYPATIFLVVDYLDRSKSFDWIDDGAKYGPPLSAHEVMDALKDNITIGSHSLSHPDLVKIGRREMKREICHSKKLLEEKFGYPVNYFAYPFGSRFCFTEESKKIVNDSGYKGAVSNIIGINSKAHDLYSLKRTRIDWNDTLPKFRMKLMGAYDWIDRWFWTLL